MGIMYIIAPVRSCYSETVSQWIGTVQEDAKETTMDGYDLNVSTSIYNGNVSVQAEHQITGSTASDAISLDFLQHPLQATQNMIKSQPALPRGSDTATTDTYPTKTLCLHQGSITCVM